MYDIIGKRKIWYTLSFIIIGVGIAAVIAGGLHWGIDFTGGSLIRISFPENRPSASSVVESLASIDLGSVQAQPLGDTEMTLRVKEINQETYLSVLAALRSSYGQVDEQSFESIGPTIGQELRSKSVEAIILVLVFILGYITFAFRKAGSRLVKSWVYGTGAIVALLHDLLVTVGMYAVLGYFLNVEIDALFITALLTVLGFSIHDTIVVYDRIRENIKRFPDRPFPDNVNISINQTFVRSLNTSLTTLLVLVALYLFGGETIQYFILTLIIGIVAGTYSSIYIASSLLVTWYNFRHRT